MHTPGYEPGAILYDEAGLSALRAIRLSDGMPVILKRAATPAAAQALRREYRFLQRTELPGTVRVLGWREQENIPALETLEAFGMGTVAELDLAGRLPAPDVLELMVSLVRALDAAHRAGVVHCQVVPSELLCDPVLREVRLYDFRRARLAGEAAGRMPPDTACLAPELTGRVDLPVDARTDFYQAGAVMYELLTGKAPFADADPARRAHRHLAVMPPPPSQVAAVPEALSGVALKLLAKNPDQRYQTASGLLYDLERCFVQLRAGRARFDFVPGGGDYAGERVFESRRYGRERELTSLVAAFARAATGRAEAVILSGTPETDRRGLAEDLFPKLAERRGQLAEWTFTPAEGEGEEGGGDGLAFLGGLAPVCEYWASEAPEGAREALRARLAAVGSGLRLLVSALPSLKPLLDAGLPAAPVDDAAARRAAVTGLFRALAAPEHPLYLLLDGWERAPEEAVAAVAELMAERELRHVLVVVVSLSPDGGDGGHPLARLRGLAREWPTEPLDLTLSTPDAERGAEAMADWLEVSATEAKPLAAALLAKSGGNERELSGLVRELRADGLLVYDAAARRWRWDLPAIERIPPTASVLERQKASWRSLPPETLEVLRAAALLGESGSGDDLALMAGGGENAAGGLRRLAEGGYLVRERGGGWRFVHPAFRSVVAEATTPDELAGMYGRAAAAFAAAAGAAGSEEAARLLRIRAAEYRWEAEKRSPAGSGRSVAERRERAGTLEAAGREALELFDYGRAAELFGFGVAALGEEGDGWEADPGLMFRLQASAYESLVSARRFDEARRWYKSLLARVRSAEEDRRLSCARLADLFGQWRFQEAAELGLALLPAIVDALGLPDDEAPAADLLARYCAPEYRERLLTPAADAEEKRRYAGALAMLAGASYGFDLEAREALRRLNRRAVEAAFAGGGWTGVQANVSLAAYEESAAGRIRVADALSSLAFEAAERFGGGTGGAWVVRGLGIEHWRRPYAGIMSLNERLREEGARTGDRLLSAFAAFALVNTGWNLGLPLERLSAFIADARRECGDRADGGEVALRLLAAARQIFRHIAGETFDLDTFDSADFSEEEFLRVTRRMPAAQAYWQFGKLQNAFLLGDTATALAADRELRRLPAELEPTSMAGELALYRALLRCRQAEAAEGNERRAFMGEAEAEGARLRRWETFCPENFRHKRLLVEAECMRLGGRGFAATERYNDAIRDAEHQGLALMAAVGHELAGRHWERERLPDYARHHLSRSLAAYRRLGAAAKADQLRRTSPSALVDGPVPDGLGRNRPVPAEAGAEDSGVLAQAAAALGEEFRPEDLADRLLGLALDESGSSRAVLALAVGGGVVAAEKQGSGRARAPETPTALEECDPTQYPRKWLRTALGDTSTCLRFAGTREKGNSGDQYLDQVRPATACCLGLAYMGSPVGALYLENRLTEGAVVQDRLAMVRLLATQAAVALADHRERRRRHDALSAMDRLLRTGQDLLGIRSPEEYAEAMLARLRELLEWQGPAALCRVESGGKASWLAGTGTFSMSRALLLDRVRRLVAGERREPPPELIRLPETGDGDGELVVCLDGRRRGGNRDLRLFNLAGYIMAVGLRNVRAMDRFAQAHRASAVALAHLGEYREMDAFRPVLVMADFAEAMVRRLYRDGVYTEELSDGLLRDIGPASLLHDVGKVAIPSEILRKPGALDRNEREIMETHAAVGGDILDRAAERVPEGGAYLRLAAEAARHHHERWDGGGYPNRTAGRAIPLVGRIVALLDVYDALSSPRAYKQAFPPDKCRRLIVEGRGGHFDPVLTDLFLAELETRPWPNG